MNAARRSKDRLGQAMLGKARQGKDFSLAWPGVARHGKAWQGKARQEFKQKAPNSLIPACLSIEQIEIPIESPDPWETDTRAVRIPSTGGRILAHRPCFHNWSLTFTLLLDTEVMDCKLLRDIVDAAGKRIGLGDFRPDCKGPFGKFVVDSWAEGSA